MLIQEVRCKKLLKFLKKNFNIALKNLREKLVEILEDIKKSDKLEWKVKKKIA